MSTEYTIGELAKAADVPSSTIRYYERRGLVTPDNRSGGNYRLYSQDALQRVRFIRAAQATGFTLEDVATLLNLRVSANRPCEDVQGLMEERLDDVTRRMADLRHVQSVLKAFLEKCQSTSRRGYCAVIEELDAACCPPPATVTRSTSRGRVPRIEKALRESGVESRFAPSESRLRVEVMHLVRRGKPVTRKEIEHIGARLGMTEKDANALVERVSETDAKGRVIGILGLSQKRHPHRFKLRGQLLSSWCAWDALFLPALLGETAEVESTCPATKDKIRVTVAPEGVLKSEPANVVLSIAVPKLKGKKAPAREQVWEAFCQHVRFFSSEQAATRSLSQTKREVYVVSLDEAFELGKRTFAELLPPAS